MIYQVPTRIHNETGYWGPVDAIHQFCEPHYNTSYYVAEFWNTMTSIVFVLAAWNCYSRLQHAEALPSTISKKATSSSTTPPGLVWMKVACGWLAVIGVGSFLYHGTMRRSMQLLDEGPMICFMASCVMGKLQYHSWTRKHANLFRLAVVVGSAALMYIYAILESYELFVHGFTIFLFMEGAAGFGWKKVGNANYALLATVSICLGRVVWESEQRLCDSFPHLWPLHIVWHGLGCSAAYSWLMFNISLVSALQKRLPSYSSGSL